MPQPRRAKSFRNLRSATRNFDFGAKIIAQGGRAFMMMMEENGGGNPFTADHDRHLWDLGYKQAQNKWWAQERHWREVLRDEGGRDETTLTITTK